MKRIISTVVLAAFSIGSAAAMVGCSASASVDPNATARPASSSDTSTYKKTTVRDANGNVVEQKVTKSSY